MNVYAIGMDNGANLAILKTVATKPEYVKTYNSVTDFESDVYEILFDTCKITSEVVVDSEEIVTLESFEGQAAKKVKMQAVKPGQTRTFQMNYFNDTIVNLKVNSEKMDIIVYASFNQMFPSEVDYEFKERARKNRTEPVLIKLNGNLQSRGQKWIAQVKVFW